MKDERGDIERLLQEKIQNIEVPVNTELWKGIAQNIPVANVTSFVISKGLLFKIVAATIVVGGISSVTYLTLKEELKQVKSSEDTQKVKQQESTHVKADENRDLQKEVVFTFPEEQKKLTEKISSSSQINKHTITQQQEPSQAIKNEEIFVANNEKEPVVKMKSEHSEISRQEEVVELVEDTKIEKEVQKESIVQNSVSEESISKGEITHFPNIFSPNGDASNDYLFIQSRNLLDFNAVVLDSSGNVVYRSTDADFKWNGRGNNGELVASGKYILYVVAKDGKGNTISKSGSLMITY